MKKWYAGIMAVLFLAITTSVFAFGHGPGRCKGGEAGFRSPMGMAANLNLSKEQTEKMWKLKEAFRNDTQKIRYELFQKRIELKAIYADPKMDDATILAKQKELNNLRQNMQDKMVQMRLEQRKLLTQEQIKKLGEMTYGPGFNKMGGKGGPAGRGTGFGPVKN